MQANNPSFLTFFNYDDEESFSFSSPLFAYHFEVSRVWFCIKLFFQSFRLYFLNSSKFGKFFGMPTCTM